MPLDAWSIGQDKRLFSANLPLLRFGFCDNNVDRILQIVTTINNAEIAAEQYVAVR